MEALAPPAPNAVPLMDMNYVIRLRAHPTYPRKPMGFSGFHYLSDAYVMLKHLQILAMGTLVVYELVDNQTGSVVRSTDDPS